MSKLSCGTMYALVLFADDDYYICKHTDIKNKGNESIIRYKGSRFVGEVVARNGNKQELIFLKETLKKEYDAQHSGENAIVPSAAGFESHPPGDHISTNEPNTPKQNAEKKKIHTTSKEERAEKCDSQHIAECEFSLSVANIQPGTSVDRSEINESRISHLSAETKSEYIVSKEGGETKRDSQHIAETTFSPPVVDLKSNLPTTLSFVKEVSPSIQTADNIEKSLAESCKTTAITTENGPPDITENTRLSQTFSISNNQPTVITSFSDVLQNTDSINISIDMDNILDVSMAVSVPEEEIGAISVNERTTCNNEVELIWNDLFLNVYEYQTSLDEQNNNIERKVAKPLLPFSGIAKIKRDAPQIQGHLILQGRNMSLTSTESIQYDECQTNLANKELTLSSITEFDDEIESDKKNNNFETKPVKELLPISVDEEIQSGATQHCQTDVMSRGINVSSTSVPECTMSNSIPANVSLEDISTMPSFSFCTIREDEDHLNAHAPVGSAFSENCNDDENCDACSSSDGSVYIPDENYSDGDTDSENEQVEQNTISDKTGRESMRSGNASTDLDASLMVNKVGHSAPDDGEMFVKTVESGTKKDFCMYCETEQAKLSRHIARKHKDEEDVAKFLSYEIGSNERKEMMAAIRKKAHFYFNTNIAINTGERKVARRPNVRFEKNASDFATCPLCLADYAKSSLRHHFKRCSKRSRLNRRTILLRSKKITGRIHPLASDILRKRVFPTMVEDDIVKCIRYDELVILFGNKLCQKYKDPHFYDMIRQRLRQLGRFLSEIRTNTTDIWDFFSVFYPRNYDATIAAIQSLAGLNESQTGFKIPSLATSLGTLLKQIGKVCISTWIKRQCKEKQTYAEDFLKLLTEDYTTSIARTALETQVRKKRQKKTILPSQGDIQKLQLHLRNEIRKNYKALEIEFSEQSWVDLAAALLLSIQLFNRRRPGETERMFIKDFQSYQKIDESTAGDGYQNFSIEEKRAAQKYVRFEIRGKLLRTVPVLLHRELVACIDLILKLRNKAKVDENNPYVFGIRGTMRGDHKYLRACELMRRYATECGAEKPETLRGTILRKHVATMCVNFNLTDCQVTDLANFMGHAERIHKEHYRQPIISRDIIQISKLLEIVQGNDDDFGDDSSGSEDEIDTSFQELTSSCQADTSLNHSEATSSEVFSEPQRQKEKKKRSTSPFGKCSRVRWNAKEKEVAFEAFQDCIISKKLPSFQKIQEVIDANPRVFKRNPATIKAWVSNQIKKA